ncbi:Beta-fructofuranosidase [Heracleum sosnowskyi]|uniref:Beta-fructofuranosidase n=1 Tax=Heracleum sosnowskyi TaxID=360622 RepID=A0AAD8MK73_9APIA|nr:Beta-fructofuranosidase [Heracleum sosnowskyi]KAK1376397.1 Beta-fructofuranosidase [Heracleum sosnowskyi]
MEDRVTISHSSCTRQTDGNTTLSIPPGRRRSLKFVPALNKILALVMFLLLNGYGLAVVKATGSQPPGVSEGVSMKSFRSAAMGSRPRVDFAWNSTMLSWQRTSFHFQPPKNWMNGPLFYKGWYHLFYQYNPDGANWGPKIVWGHAASKDLIHWDDLPVAMAADEWYDFNGVWTGSATMLPNGQIMVLYTGSTNESVQVQNLAYPANLSDPLLTKWVKYPNNPVLKPPPGIGSKDFRDPTTAWLTPEGKWRFIIGSKRNTTGISFAYDTEDFKNITLLDGLLHEVQGTGMWECVDFYPVPKPEENGVHKSFDEPGVKYVMKASLDEDRNDYYALGTYDLAKGTWVPDNPKLDVGIGLRYDYGIYYASKTFYDSNKNRRVLWSWIKETDSISSDIEKGWASVQGIPRTVLFDNQTGSNLLQWPVEEIDELRSSNTSFENVKINAGAVVPLKIGSTSQLDITAEFEVDKESLERVQNTNEVYNCNSSTGAAGRGALGPFGLLVLAYEDLSEQTPIYFYIVKGSDGNLQTFFCADLSRSSEATDVDKEIYGSTVPVLPGENLKVRILVDHSIVESFSQGGRTCITSRVYPTKAISDDAKIFLFNNATEANITASLNIWQMKSTA